LEVLCLFTRDVAAIFLNDQIAGRSVAGQLFTRADLIECSGVGPILHKKIVKMTLKEFLVAFTTVDLIIWG
jgi:hypothetical protein